MSEQLPDHEPSVLDYVKSLIFRDKGKPLPLPAAPEAIKPEPSSELSVIQQEKKKLPLLTILAVIFVIVGQFSLEPVHRNVTNAVIFYALGMAALGFALNRREWTIPALERKDGVDEPVKLTSTSGLLGVLGMVFTLAALLVFWLPSFISPENDSANTFLRENRFNLLNIFLWGGAIVCTSLSFADEKSFIRSLYQKIGRWINGEACHIQIKPWHVLLISAIILVGFFRLHQLNEVPGEMWSDHAEKLLDVWDVQHGSNSIFFERNTGREGFQMYLTAFMAWLFNTGISFMSLKLGTVFCGLVALIFVYKLGLELGGRWVGLFAFLLAGISYWNNVIARVGLRYVLYPFAVAPVLFYLIRGLRQKRRNDFVWAGLWLGLGLHGYSSTRFLPFVVVIGTILFILHQTNRERRNSAWTGLLVIGLVSLVVFLPLLAYATTPGNWEMFMGRSLTRLSTTETQYPGPVVQIFFSNLWKAMIMFFYDNGQIWVHSIPGRPALDVVSAAVYFFGFILVLYRYIREKNWEDLFLLISIPLLLMPSILSLAFPDENPSLNRTAGTMVPVFIVAGIGMDSLLRSLRKLAWGKVLSILVTGILIYTAITQNYSLVFKTYKQQFLAGAWNTSQMGEVIGGFVKSGGTMDTAYVVPFPYWVDTRLVGINAGFPTKDYALWPDQFESTLSETREKLFIVKQEDTADLEKLQSLYPQGTVTLYDVTEYEGKDFYIFRVPAVGSTTP